MAHLAKWTLFDGLVTAHGMGYRVAVWHDCSTQRPMPRTNQTLGIGARLPLKMGVALAKKNFRAPAS